MTFKDTDEYWDTINEYKTELKYQKDYDYLSYLTTDELEDLIIEMDLNDKLVKEYRQLMIDILLQNGFSGE